MPQSIQRPLLVTFNYVLAQILSYVLFDRMYSCVRILEAHIGRVGPYWAAYCKPHWLYNERSPPPRIGWAVFPYSLYFSTVISVQILEGLRPYNPFNAAFFDLGTYLPVLTFGPLFYQIMISSVLYHPVVGFSLGSPDSKK